MNELEYNVIKWAADRGIYSGSTVETRVEKLWEEVEELIDAISYHNHQIGDPADRLEDIKLEAGDVLVCMINILHPLRLDLRTCLDAAYQKIKNRTGRMIDGQFVRDE